VADCEAALERLARELPADVGVLIGHPSTRDQPAGCVANAASLLSAGTIQATISKALLPNYDVFDERRYFRPAVQVQPISWREISLGVHICEDAWFGHPETFYHTFPSPSFDPVARLQEAGAEILINLSASPFEINKVQTRWELLARHCQRGRTPCVFVNQVGGNDDLVFDGASLVLTAQGKVQTQLPAFAEALQIVDVSLPANADAQVRLSAAEAGLVVADRVEQLRGALVTGLRDYAHKTGFREAVFGLSGGIDSAVACCLAAEALGPENVHVLLLPSRHSSDHSVNDSWLLAERLGIDAQLISIDEVHRSYELSAIVQEDLASQPGGLVDQNLQARIRGALVMIRSNRHNWLALATGNKSELAMGYCTLYGDMAGGFAVLSDVLKRDVYALARHYNQRAGRDVIPVNIIEKAPSAELAPNQFDQDSLPDYDLLDAILEGLIEREQSAALLSQTYPAEVVNWVLQRLDRNEFKRRQMPPGIKLTRRAFGSGRRMPMAARVNRWE